ncbi:MAG: hypothetical protein EP343_32765 [Deltaproteobacteria bacterium]|nr:MAG: hypothetical protein EP343_32765 [Deltaproteobacteria bacterium]
MSDLILLTHAPNRALAQPLIDFLDYHDIEAIVQSDDCGGVDPALNFINGTRILVWKVDYERAQTFLEDFYKQSENLIDAED